MGANIEFSIQMGDIVTFNADVVALKYAQSNFGVDLQVSSLLRDAGIQAIDVRPRIGDYSYLSTHATIQSPHILFVGVSELGDFDYLQIRKFSARTLNILAQQAPQTRHIAMTIHGVGYGLDEVGASLSQLAGYIDAIQTGDFPSGLSRITIVDIDPDRVQRLRIAFEHALANTASVIRVAGTWAYQLVTPKFLTPSESSRALTNVSRDIETKAHAFVAMPFHKEMSDIFYYGIQQPVHNAGFLCERVDEEVFIGDVLEQIKKKIDTAKVVIAELSGANPNVYLELGYAWGKGRPTVLLIQDEQELRFDVRSQRCLKYKSIRHLEETLNRELKELQLRNFI